MLEVERLPMLQDNYSWLLLDSATGTSAVVDPPEAAPVLARLEALGRGLDWVLATHHHADHIGGIPELKARTGCRVVGPAADAHRIPGLDVQVREGDVVRLGESVARVIETPGHTSGHISFWFEADRQLFCGDTLFALGCGRLFEGTPETMWASLQKLMALPDDARVCCGHEYTQSNARFALTVEPDNLALRRRAAEIDQLRARGEPTVPSTMGEERATNPFLRAGNARRFGEIRAAKDRA
jgi:hydroxyacylglutathione hydrolase